MGLGKTGNLLGEDINPKWHGRCIQGSKGFRETKNRFAVYPLLKFVNMAAFSNIERPQMIMNQVIMKYFVG